MLGARVDQLVVTQLLKEKMPKLLQHMEKCYFDPSMITLQWFSCLFSYNFNFEVLQRLWDVFFLKGDKVLFRISLAIYHLLTQKIMKCSEVTEISKVMEGVQAML